MSAVPTAAVDNENPWPGLEPFTEAQHAFFFGRDEEARELSRRLERKTLTVLFGQSGLGKSSLLQAGVFPRLHTSGYCPIYVRLDYNPLAAPPAEQVKTAVLRGTSKAGSWTHPGVAAQGETLWEFFHHREDVLHGLGGEVLMPVLVFDQFEEVFTVGAASADTRQRAQAFLDELADLIENRPPAAFEAKLDAGKADVEAFDFTRSDYRVLIALREDYLPHLESLKGPIPSLMQNRMRLTRLTGTQALEAVTKPAAGRVSDAVAKAIVAFIAGRADLPSAEVEPALLSLVCRELNFRRRAIGASTIEASLLEGSRDTILTEFYERALADLPPAVRHFVEDDLVTETGFRENLALERAQKKLAAAGADLRALDTLVARRLLRYEERLDLRRVELTHDVLCGVVKASRAERHAREAQAAEERRLRETEMELARARAEEAGALRQAYRARLIAAGCAILAVLAIAAAGFGYLNLRRARAAEDKALKTEQLAQMSRGEAERIVNYMMDDLRDDLEPLGRATLLEGLLKQVIAYYEHLPLDLRVPDTELNHAIAYALASRISLLLNKKDLGEQQLEKADAILKQVGNRGEPELLAIARAQILVVHSLSFQYHGQTSDSITAARQAVAELEPFLKAASPSASVLTVAGDATFYFGLQLTRSYLREGETQLDRSVAILRSLKTRYPEDSVKADNKIARAVSWSAFEATRVGAGDQAEARAKEAISLTTDIRKADPSNSAALTFQGSALIGLAATYLANNKIEETLPLNAQREIVSQQRLAIDPSNVTYNNNLVVGRIYSAVSLLRLGRSGEALQQLDGVEASAKIMEKGSVFHNANLVGFETDRAELLAAEGRRSEAVQHEAKASQISKMIIDSESLDSDEHNLRVERGVAATRQVALAAGEYGSVRSSARNSVSQLSKMGSANDESASARKQLQLNMAYESWGRAAAEEQAWPEAESAWRQALAANALHAFEGENGNLVGYVSLLTSDLAPAAREAATRTWLAWVCAHEGKGEEAVSLANAGLDYQRKQIAQAGDRDVTLRLALAFAEITLARAQIETKADPALVTAGLSDAAKVIASLPDEFRSTTWVKEVASKLTETQGLVGR